MAKVKQLWMEFRLPLADFTNGELPLHYPGGYCVITTSLKAKEDRKQETEDDALLIREWLCPYFKDRGKRMCTKK